MIDDLLKDNGNVICRYCWGPLDIHVQLIFGLLVVFLLKWLQGSLFFKEILK